MKVWINKVIWENPSEEFNTSLVFNIAVPGYGGLITSNIRDRWYRILGVQNVTGICEDLYIIALSVFAADKRLPRSRTCDGWTRQIKICIPVLEIERWRTVQKKLEQTLSYLSGDVWEIEFRVCSENNRYIDLHKRVPDRNPKLNSIEAVSLFSGGLDSFCGAYWLLENNTNTIFVGYKEYGKLESVQDTLIRSLDNAYPEVEKMLFPFTAKAFSPIGGNALPAENTSRSRSFLFIASAVCVAESVREGIPVYIPENGFIGLNLPLTLGRSGSCSTRTTHPYFIKQLNGVLRDVGISHMIINPFAFDTKREMVQRYIDAPMFIENIHQTISCSHPCNGRWQGRPNPENCGYCYPCLIRQSSLLNVEVPYEHYKYDVLSYSYIQNSTEAKHSDFVDLLNSINLAMSSTDGQLMRRIRATGRLSNEEVNSFLRLYKATMQDLLALISQDPEIARMVGVTHEFD